LVDVFFCPNVCNNGYINNHHHLKGKTMSTKITHGTEIETGEEWDLHCCILCDRPVGANPLYVHLVGGGVTVQAANSDEAFEQGGDMGYWAVGATCAKKFAEGVLFSAEYVNAMVAGTVA
jgi:hypothetical protein